MFCLTLVQCSSLLCVTWTILSTKMHLHMFPLLKMLCKTMKFFHRLKMRKNVVSLLLPNDRRLAVPGSLLFAIPLCLRRNALCKIVHNCAYLCIIVHCIIQGLCVNNTPRPPQAPPFSFFLSLLLKISENFRIQNFFSNFVLWLQQAKSLVFFGLHELG